jgi:hypothetical protein
MADKPIRIQLSRAKGWRMPENTVKVDRTTKWGNPFKLLFPGRHGATVAVNAFRRALADRDHSHCALIADQIGELRGKNLACWCPLDQPCHADVLLELANADDVVRGNIDQVRP